MAIWDTLPQASLNGTTFPISGRKASGGRAFARRRYPFQNGQVTEDTGREPRVIEYQIPLYAGVDGFGGTRFTLPLYPDTFRELHSLATSDLNQGLANLIDPEFGAMPVRIASWNWATDPSKRDGGELTLSFEEEGEAIRSRIFSVSSDAPAVSSLEAENVDAAFAEAGAPMAFLPAGYTTLSTYVGQFVATVQGGVSFDETAALLDTARGVMTTALATSFLQDAANYRAMWSVMTLVDSLTRTAELAIADGPNAIEWTTPSVLSSYDIALELYGDSSMYLIVEQRNPTPNPLFYPAGTVIFANPRAA